MIDKTDDRVLTEYARHILDILTKDFSSRFDDFEVLEYLPELSHTFNAYRPNDFVGVERYTVFRARNLVTEQEGYLCYSDQDRFEFKDLSFVLQRVRRSTKFKVVV